MDNNPSKSRKDEELNRKVKEVLAGILKEDPNADLSHTELFDMLYEKVRDWVASFVRAKAAKKTSFKALLNHYGSVDDAINTLTTDIICGVKTEEGKVRVKPVFDKLKEYDDSRNDSVIGFFNSVVYHECQHLCEYELDKITHSTRTFRKNMAKMESDPDSLSERQKKNLLEHTIKTESLDHPVPGSDKKMLLHEMIGTNPCTDSGITENKGAEVLVNILFPDDGSPHSKDHDKKIKRREERKKEYLRERIEKPDDIEDLIFILNKYL